MEPLLSKFRVLARDVADPCRLRHQKWHYYYAGSSICHHAVFDFLKFLRRMNTLPFPAVAGPRSSLEPRQPGPNHKKPH